RHHLGHAARRATHPAQSRSRRGRPGRTPGGGRELRMKLRAHLRSALAQAGAGVRAAPLLSAAAALSLALGTLLRGTIYSASRNATLLLHNWGEGVQLTIYLEPGAQARAAAVAESLRRLPAVEHVRFITPVEAMQRLREGMGSRSPLLDG